MQHTAAPPVEQRPGEESQPTPRPAVAAGPLAAVLADPADDLARMVAADWYDDAGDSDRAAIIRVQVELARRSHPRSGRARSGQAATARLLRAEVRRLERLDDPGHARRWGCHGADARGDRVEAAIDHYRLAWRRGFVETVWLTADAFWGGPCDACGGDGSVWWPADGEWGRCPACRGTGEQAGLARRLFARHPLTRVRLTDRRPEEAYGRAWWAAADGGPDRPSHVHPDVFPLLPATFGWWLDYSRRDPFEAWHDALSAACVRYGRKLAGLPALTTGVNRG